MPPVSRLYVKTIPTTSSMTLRALSPPAAIPGNAPLRCLPHLDGNCP
jgi:hypothetical protein